ncbi:MAG: bifunctional 4-hydroxy-2-oxoglutarate aldolase/2-dehydro-3-deoxy-phosphogluconate aldolase [Mycobacteriales bacterium]
MTSRVAVSDPATSALLAALADVPLVGIIRKCPPEHVTAVAAVAAEAGLRVIEITLDSARALDQIAAVARDVPGLLVGAGTTLSVQDVHGAADAGAGFVVSPLLDLAVVAAARQRGVAAVPGGVTPTELVAGWQAGASLVKLFPAGPLGTGYLRALRGPLSDMSVLVTGGIGVADVRDWVRSGAQAVGLGSDVFSHGALAAPDLGHIATLVRTAVAAAGEEGSS